VLNDRWRERRIHSHTRDRVLAAARRLGYRPNRLALGLKSNRTNTIGLVIRTMEHPHQAYINERIVLSLEAQKFEVLATVVPNLADIAEMEELYYSHRPEGLIIGPLYAQDSAPFFSKLVRDGFPLVGYHGGERFPGDQVTHDMHEVIALAVRHLKELGHSRIGRVTAAADKSVDDHFAELTGGGRTHYFYGSLENGLQFGMRVAIGRDEPTAYVFEDPLFAIGFLRAAARRGIAVPEEVAFVTGSCGKFGDYLPLTLTSAYPDLDEIADRVVRLVVERIRDELSSERHIVSLKPRLRVGESTVRGNSNLGSTDSNQ
jgi:LacI family transcriptional regulator